MIVTFHGVRGSFPSSSPATARYGGNTASVRVDCGSEPVILDLGSGVHAIQVGREGEVFRASALVTHLHLDHIMGLPFFAPLDRPGARLDIYAPAQPGMALVHAFDNLVQPPFFPFRLHDLRGQIELIEAPREFEVGTTRVISRPVPHLGPTLGYRIEHDGSTLAYVSDHQQPNGMNHVADEVLELCAGVDVLVHDAQYTPQELEEHRNWGHSSVNYAVEVARQAGAQRLCLFHHDPAHSDDDLDRQLEAARGAARGERIEVLAAYEGLTLVV